MKRIGKLKLRMDDGRIKIFRKEWMRNRFEKIARILKERKDFVFGKKVNKKEE